MGGGGDIPVFSIIAEQIQGDGNLIRSRRRGGAPGGGGSTELPRSRGLMMSGAGGGGGGGDDGSLEGSASATMYIKKTVSVRRLMLFRMCEIKFQYINIITHKSRGEVSTCPFDRIKH